MTRGTQQCWWALLCAMTSACALAQVPAGAAPAPKIVAVEPSAPVLPASTLRLYVHFDQSARGWVRTQDLELRQADGTPVVAAFMNLGQDLWSADGRRLTVLFDPGRVKRDVSGPGAEAAPLQAGRSYQVLIGTYRQSFLAGPAVRQPLAAEAWHVEAPLAGARAEVVLVFDRVMDAGLAASQIAVRNAHGNLVGGSGWLDAAGTRWRFKPDRPWRAGPHRIELRAALEDVTGNRLGEALDRPVEQDSAPQTGASLNFLVECTAFKRAHRRRAQ